jgi:hypothetical protein
MKNKGWLPRSSGWSHTDCEGFAECAPLGKPGWSCNGLWCVQDESPDPRREPALIMRIRVAWTVGLLLLACTSEPPQRWELQPAVSQPPPPPTEVPSKAVPTEPPKVYETSETRAPAKPNQRSRVAPPAAVAKLLGTPSPCYLGHYLGGSFTFLVPDLSKAEHSRFAADTIEHEQVLDTKDPRIPGRFEVGTRFELASEHGRTGATVRELYLEDLLDERGLFVVLTLDERLEGEHGVLVFPAGRAPAGEIDRLEPIAEDVEPFDELLAAVREASKSVGGPRPTTEELQVVPVRLRGQARHLFAFQATSGQEPDWEADFDRIAAGYGIADGEGEVLRWLMPAKRGEGYSFESVLRFDLEGDGFDEVVYAVRYYEGTYWLLLDDRADGEYEVRWIAGYGA